jgi:hypothetical protein
MSTGTPRLDAVSLHPDNPNQGDVEAIQHAIDRNNCYGAIVVQASTRPHPGRQPLLPGRQGGPG